MGELAILAYRLSDRLSPIRHSLRRHGLLSWNARPRHLDAVLRTHLTLAHSADRA